ncbi:phage major capsid protein [Ensifer sp. ENS07]|uniref:phage major capsid protein n=1 Tax=Ensifer sp. ENS07 TaxID=2769274 RepID=UPI001FEEFC82|nr:phage major capsid protein [Ensifer sp. ENS07]
MKIGHLLATFAVAAIVCAVVAASAFGPLDLHAMASSSDLVGTSLAMTMVPGFNLRARGITGVRADGNNATQILNELKTTFEQFKAAREEEIKGINAKFADVVTTEKVDRINNEITALNKALNEANQLIAAAALGNTGGTKHDPDVEEHSQAFNKFFRKGVDNGLRDLEVKAKLTTQSDPDGGYLVPEETENTIDRVLGVVSAIRSLARVIRISGSEYKKLVNIGGTTSGWVGEEDERPATGTPTLREIVLACGEIYAQPGATQTTLDDARIDIASWLGDEVSIEFSEQEGKAFASGNGKKKPRGFLTYDNVADANWAWGKIGYVASGDASGFAGASATVSPADALIDLYYALKAGYRQGASFLMSDKVMGTVRKFKDADGNFIWNAPSAVGEVATILQKPVYTDDNMPAVGANAFPIAFGDFRRAYTIADRTGIRVLRDPFTSKPNVLFYTTKRVGGGVTNFEALKLMKIATS